MRTREDNSSDEDFLPRPSCYLIHCQFLFLLISIHHFFNQLAIMPHDVIKGFPQGEKEPGLSTKAQSRLSLLSAMSNVIPLTMLLLLLGPLSQMASDINTPERHSTQTKCIGLHRNLRYGPPEYSADIGLGTEDRKCIGNPGILQHAQAGPSVSFLTPFWWGQSPGTHSRSLRLHVSNQRP